MREYGCLEALGMSFFSKKIYRDVVLNWSGSVILYLILLLALSWLLLMYPFQKGANKAYHQFTQKYVQQIPEMTVKDGVLKTPENRPYLITDPDDNKVVAVIDTSGTFKNLSEAKASVLITADSLMYKDNSDVEKTQKFSSKYDFTITPLAIQSMGDKFVAWLWVIVFPFLLLFSFLFNIIVAAFYALIGMIAAVFMKSSLTYGEIYKITIIALTPVVFLSTLTTFIDFPFAHQRLCYFLITLGYIIFGISANKTNKEMAA